MQFREGQIVSVANVASSPFFDKVRGMATIEYATLGRMIIIEPYRTFNMPLPKDIESEFSCMIVPENSISV
jgi:hypothetical protein